MSVLGVLTLNIIPWIRHSTTLENFGSDPLFIYISYYTLYPEDTYCILIVLYFNNNNNNIYIICKCQNLTIRKLSSLPRDRSCV